MAETDTTGCPDETASSEETADGKLSPQKILSIETMTRQKIPLPQEQSFDEGVSSQVMTETREAATAEKDETVSEKRTAEKVPAPKNSSYYRELCIIYRRLIRNFNESERCNFYSEPTPERLAAIWAAHEIPAVGDAMDWVRQRTRLGYFTTDLCSFWKENWAKFKEEKSGSIKQSRCADLKRIEKYKVDFERIMAADIQDRTLYARWVKEHKGKLESPLKRPLTDEEADWVLTNMPPLFSMQYVQDLCLKLSSCISPEVMIVEVMWMVDCACSGCGFPKNLGEVIRHDFSCAVQKDMDVQVSRNIVNCFFRIVKEIALKIGRYSPRVCLPLGPDGHGPLLGDSEDYKHFPTLPYIAASEGEKATFPPYVRWLDEYMNHCFPRPSSLLFTEKLRLKMRQTDEYLRQHDARQAALQASQAEQSASEEDSIKERTAANRGISFGQLPCLPAAYCEKAAKAEVRSEGRPALRDIFEALCETAEGDQVPLFQKDGKGYCFTPRLVVSKKKDEVISSYTYCKKPHSVKAVSLERAADEAAYARRKKNGAFSVPLYAAVWYAVLHFHEHPDIGQKTSKEDGEPLPVLFYELQHLLDDLHLRGNFFLVAPDSPKDAADVPTRLNGLKKNIKADSLSNPLALVAHLCHYLRQRFGLKP